MIITVPLWGVINVHVALFSVIIKMFVAVVVVVTVVPSG